LLDRKNLPITGVDVVVSDGLNAMSRPVGKTDANGEFADAVTLPAGRQTGNYQLSYAAAGKKHSSAVNAM